MTNPAVMPVFVLTALKLGSPEGCLRPGRLSPGGAARLTCPGSPRGALLSPMALGPRPSFCRLAPQRTQHLT